jgi:hypothetical protein
MKSQQPVWKFVANLGDANPIEHGGYAVFVDETGVYAPECELLETPEDTGREVWEVRRIVCDTCTLHPEGFISDNRFHPGKAAWFGSVEDLQELASFTGQSVADITGQFTSEDPLQRAQAWRTVGEYYGFINLDEYPRYFNREEITQRWAQWK